MVGASMPLQRDVPFLSIVPIAEARSSYNGLLIFLLHAARGRRGRRRHSSFGVERDLRRGPAWDCGYPDPSTKTQYSASSFAQPIRRVFGTLVFRARERVEMPPPLDAKPARLTVRLRDTIWDTLYAPIGVAVEYVADRLNRLQYLSIRHYLSFVFAALVGLLLVLAIWP